MLQKLQKKNTEILQEEFLKSFRDFRNNWNNLKNLKNRTLILTLLIIKNVYYFFHVEKNFSFLNIKEKFICTILFFSKKKIRNIFYRKL